MFFVPMFQIFKFCFHVSSFVLIFQVLSSAPLFFYGKSLNLPVPTVFTSNTFHYKSISPGVYHFAMWTVTYEVFWGMSLMDRYPEIFQLLFNVLSVECLTAMLASYNASRVV